MTIRITVAGGVDLNGYLADFEADFVRNGNGFFSDNPRDLSGDEFAQSSGPDATLPIEGGLSYIAESGDEGDFVYDFQTNVVGGTLDGVQFGAGLSYRAASDDFTTDASVTIRGLDLNGSSAGNDVSTLLGGLRNADLSFLEELLRGDDIQFSGSSGADRFVSFGGDDAIGGAGGADSFNGGAGDDSISGGAGADTLLGAAGADTLLGGVGVDSLSGGQGDDQIVGGAGADVLLGGAGADTLTGGAGSDTLTGGPGRDVFLFTEAKFGLDVITGFTAGKSVQDVISFADGAYAGAFDSFSDLLAGTRDVDGSAVITLAKGATITLDGVLESHLQANDFLFG